MSQKFSANASFQRYRIVVISTWPDSESKRAALAAAEAALQEESAFESVAGWAAPRQIPLSRLHETSR